MTLATLTIDLDAIAANYRQLCARHGGAVAAVVKADGYGLGAARVAARLAREGCPWFFVATLDEALDLAASLPHARIATLTGIAPQAVREQAARHITPVINTLPDLALWRAEAARLEQTLPAFLHLDTGMNRLGLDACDTARLIDAPELLAGVTLAAVMTHLVSAERPADPTNRRQLTRFHAACALLPPAPRSIANSSGMFLGPDFASDLARPGAALYGVNPTPAEPNPMQAVVRLVARVLQLRDVAAGETVGYNGIWRAAAPSRIATIGAGYADGLLRALSNRAAAFFDGTPLPLVGRVSMDLITFDATACPTLAEGAELEILGPCQAVDALAAAATTSAYEILTTLGRRYRREYLEASR